jgi:hypothetical protein
VVSLAVLVFAVAVSFAFTNPPSGWNGHGIIFLTTYVNGQHQSTQFDFNGNLTASTTDLDFGTPDVFLHDNASVITSTLVIFQDAKPTSHNAKAEKNPNSTRRQQNKALLGQLYGLQKAGAPKKPPLDLSMLGTVNIDDASITPSGTFAAIKNFTQVKGTIKMKFTFTVAGGAFDGQAGKGKFKMTYSGNRAF